VERIVPLTQTVDLVNNSRVRIDQMEKGLDYLTQIDQQQQAEIDGHEDRIVDLEAAPSGGGGGGGGYGVSVIDHGATGDGVTDDTAAFISAIGAAGEGPVYVPPGDYAVAIELTDEPVFMTGPGRLLQRPGFSAISITRSNGVARSCTISDVRYGQYQTPANQNQGDFTSIINTASDISDIKNGDNLFITSDDYYAFDAFLDGKHTYQAAWAKVHGVGINVGGLTGPTIAEDDTVVGLTSGAYALVTASSDQQDGTYRIIFSSVQGGAFADGETLQVDGVSVGVASGNLYIVLYGRTLDAYTTNAKFYKPTTAVCDIRGMTFAADGDVDAIVGQANRLPAIQLKKVQGADLDVHVESAYGSAVMLYTSFNCRVRTKVDRLPCNDSDGAWGYGAAVFGASEFNDFQIIATNCRHAFTTLVTAHSSPTYVNADTTGTPKFNVVHDSISHNTIAAGFDTHPGAYYTSFTGCQAISHFSGRRTVSDSVGFQNRAIGTRFVSCYSRNCMSGFIENSAEYGDMPFASTVVFERCTADGFLKDGFYRGNYAGNRAIVLYDGCTADGRWGTDIAEDPRRPSVHLHCGWRTSHGGNIKYVNCTIIGVTHFPWRDEGSGCKTEWRDCSVDLSRSPATVDAISLICATNAPTSYYLSGLSIRKHPYNDDSLKAVFRLTGSSVTDTPCYIDEVRWIGGGPRPLMSRDGGVTRTFVFSKMPRAFNPRTTIVSSGGTTTLTYADTTVFVTGSSPHTVQLPKAYETQTPVRIVNQSSGTLTVAGEYGSSDTVTPTTIAAGSWCDYIPYNTEWQGVASSGYSLPIASASALGGVKVGANLSIDGAGVLSASASGGGSGVGAIYDWNDFMGGSNASGITSTIYTFTASGGGFSYNSVGKFSGVTGIGIVTTGAGTTGYGTLNSGTSAIDIGEGEVDYNLRVNVPVASDGTDTFTVRIGLSDSTNGSDPTDGAFFRYTHSVNGGRWECATRSNGVETATDAGVSTGIGSTTFVKLRVLTDPSVPNVKFYVNGSLVQTHTTNIPSGAARATGLVPASILKSAGTTSRAMYVDYAEFKMTLTSAR
jgi:hypothetical protein